MTHIFILDRDREVLYFKFNQVIIKKSLFYYISKFILNKNKYRMSNLLYFFFLYCFFKYMSKKKNNSNKKQT